MLRLRRGMDFDLFAKELDRSAVLGVDSGQNLHQRAFARAVFADQRKHLARVERQVYAVERMHAGEELLNPCHVQNGFRQSITSSTAFIGTNAMVLYQASAESTAFIGTNAMVLYLESAKPAAGRERNLSWRRHSACICASLIRVLCLRGVCGFCYDLGVGNGGASAGMLEGKHVFFRVGKGFAPGERSERRKRNVSSF